MKLSYIFLLGGFLLSFHVSAMEEEDRSNNIIATRVRQSNPEQAKDIEGKNSPQTPEENKEVQKCCNHWGLSHCVAGIGEYFWRNFLCGYGFDYQRTDRAWTIYGAKLKSW